MTMTIDREKLQAWFEEGRPLTVLDVRPAEQRQDWHIPGSLHEDLYDRLRGGDPTAVDALHLPHDRPVVAVCAAGRTSLLAAELLEAQGHEVYSLEGGMKAWGRAWNTATVGLTGGVEVLQVRRTGKGCLSYLVSSDGEAVVIDAALDPQVFLDLARDRGVRIVAALDTHIHADHLSRSRPLAAKLGIPQYLPTQDRATYPHERLRDGDGVPFGGTQLEVIHTPGHTWESSSFYLSEEVLFSGDTIFVDGVGRPDLEARSGEEVERARALYDSLQRLNHLPDDLLVLPGHSSAPIAFDRIIVGARLAAVRTSGALLRLDREEFTREITTRLPATPANHARIVALNEAGEFPEDSETLEAGGNRCAVG